MSGDGPAPGKRIFDAIGAQLVLRGLGGPPPRVGDAYVIEEILGAGGFGLICRATQVAMRRSVALKLHPLGGVADAGVREALREARSLARLEHPGIVGVYAVGESELIATERLPCAYVEMQLVEGQTLRSWREAVVPEAQSLVRVLVEAGRAVAHAHEQGVLHRDLKPDNVMIDASGHAKVIDFGLALATDEVTTDRALAAWGDGADALGTRATGTGLVRGTPGYMAPEASAGRPLAASDQFALAVMLREALTGRHPMLPATVAPVAAAAGGDGVRRRLEPVLARAMAVVVAERFDDVTALCDAIEAALRPRRGPWIAAASIATLGLAAGVTWWGTEAPSVVAAPSEAPAQTSTPTESGPTVADPATDEPPPEATSDGSTGDPPLPTVQASADPGVVALPSVHGRPEAGRVSCDDLTAWSGTWQVGARVMWTEFAYQLDTKIDYSFVVTVEPRCALVFEITQYQPSVEGQPPAEPLVVTTRATAVHDVAAGWRVPLTLAFEGGPRTYAAEESYDLDLLLDFDDTDAPRLHGAFDKRTSTGFVLRNGVLLGDRAMAPGPRAITIDDLPCVSRCRVQCAGTHARRRCIERGCEAWDAEPRDICGPPSFDFLPPLRARAARKTVNAGQSPLARGLARGERARQLAACADNARHLKGRWAVWRIPKAAQAVASRLTFEVSATGCTLDGTARSDDEAESVAVSGEVTAAGTWVLTPITPMPWIPGALVFAGGGPGAPALGVGTAEPMHRLRAHRLDP